jgi:hypothetical protein
VQVEDDNPYANLEKKSKKGRRAEKNAAKPPAEKPLNHSLDIMGAFAKLSIEAPTTVSKVGGHVRWHGRLASVIDATDTSLTAYAEPNHSEGMPCLSLLFS